MNKIQQLNLDLIRLSSFNNLDGEQVATHLENNIELWKGALITRLESLICLRDLPDNYWNVDTLYITPEPGKEQELYELASHWGADDIEWIGGDRACSLLGASNPQMRSNPRLILQLWWD